jgi:hypothetical protein
VDQDFFWYSMGGAAIVTAALTLARLLLDYRFASRGKRWLDKRRQHVHDPRERQADARLERVLQDRLAEADRRFERCDAELHAALRQINRNDLAE